MRKRGIFLPVVFLLVLYSFSLSYAQSQQITNGLIYLSTSQNPDGSWGSDTSGAELLPSTVSVMETFQLLGQTGTANYSNALTWLQSQGLNTTDYLSERIHALSIAGTDDDLLLSYLDEFDYAWGGYDDFDINTLDTALALQALKTVNYSDSTVINSAIDYLISSQNPDGGWGLCQSSSLGCADGEGDSNVYMTALVSSTLQQFPQTSAIATAINKATNYLIAHQNADGGFGANAASAAPASTVYETALTVIAIINAGQVSNLPLQTTIQNALIYLSSTQLPDGSWDEDPYSTALAIRALASIKPNLSITASDITFSNPAPTVGDTITITANIHNTGSAQADNAVVQFYNGDPNSGGILIGQTTISSITAYGSSPASITWTIPTAGAGAIFVKIDPLNTIDELSESDDAAAVNLAAATLPDVSIVSADISFMPSVPLPSDIVTMAATIRNNGETATGNFTVDICDGNPSAGGMNIFSTTVPSIGGGNSAIVQLTTSFSGGRHDVYVVVDKVNSIAESDKSNNIAVKSLQVGGTIDLAVTNNDITFTPAYPTEGDSVTINAVVHNEGDTPANNVPVRLYFRDPDSGGTQIGPEVIIPEIQAGGTALVTTTWDTTGHTGNNDIYIKADPLDSITEPSELNNKAHKTIVVAARTGADLTITPSDIYYSPQAPLQGDPVTVSATIRNTGSQTAKNVVVEFSIYDPRIGSSLIIANQAILSLVSGGSTVVQATWDTKGFSGEYEIYANVDPMNTIAETDETNNIAHVPVIVTAPEGPDIVIAAINTSGITSSSQTLTVSGSADVTVKNSGTLDTGVPFVLTAFEDKNNNQQYDPGIDVILGQTTYSGNLPADAEGTIIMTVSGTIASLNNALYVFADSGNAVTETNESNNIYCLAIFTACRNANVDRAIKTGVSWLVDHQLNADAQGTMKAWGGASLYNNAVGIKAYKYTSKTTGTKYDNVLNRLAQMQAPDGSWDESSMITSNAILALISGGLDPKSSTIVDAVAWLKRVQASDGSWGWTSPSSMPAQETGLAIEALIKAGVDKSSSAIVKGVQYLTSIQNSDGYWGLYPGEASSEWTGPYPAIGLALATSLTNPKVQAARNWYDARRYNYWGLSADFWLQMMLEIDPNNSYMMSMANALLSEQDSDGGWKDASTYPISQFRTTSFSLDVLGRLGFTGSGIDKGILWIDNHVNSFWDGFDDLKGTDVTGWALDALQSANIGDYASLNAIEKGRKALVGFQISDGSWSEIPIASHGWLDKTAEALFALKYPQNISSSEQLAVNKAINFFIYSQKSDGGWPWSPELSLSHFLTSEYVLQALLQSGLTAANSSTVSRGLSYLNSKQNVDGGFDNVTQTARAAIIYKLAGSSYQSRLDGTITWLKSNQNSDGGWGTYLGYTSSVGATSWSLIALSYAGDSGIEVARGVSWLLAAQNQDAGWGGVMGVPMSHESSTAFAVWALSLSRFTLGFDIDLEVEKPYYCPNESVKVTAVPDKPVQDISLTGSVTLQEGGTYALSFSENGNSFVAEFPVPSDALPGTATVHVTGTAPYGYGIATSSFIVKDCSSLQPDLSLSDDDLSAAVQNAQDPDTRLVSAMIRNLGQRDARDVVVNFYGGSPLPENLISSQIISSIGTSGSATVNTTITISGDTTIYVVVDPDNSIPELDENNNIATIVLIRTIPDLSISASDVVIVPPFIEGQPAKIDAAIHNIGSLGASNVVVAFYDGDPQQGTLIGTVTKSYIDAGATALAEMIWNTFGQSGRNYIHVVVDPANIIEESNENNNASLIAADVAPPILPDLAVASTDITFSSLNPPEGEQLTITSTIHNLGTDTSDIEVTLYDGDPSSGGVALATQTMVQIIPFGGTAVLTFNVDTFGLPGIHKYYISVDPNNLIAETNETNNSAWSSVTVGPSGITLVCPTNKTTYTANENAQIAVDIANLQNTDRTGTLDVKVVDLNNNVVSMVTTNQPLTLAANENKTLSFTWNTGQTLAGYYKVYADFIETGIVTAKATSPISLSADISMTSGITVDKISYSPNQPVTINSSITSQSANNIFSDLTATVSLNTPGGQLIYSQTKTIPTLLPGQLGELNTYWNTGTNPPGTYQVTLQVKDAAGIVVSTAATTLVISGEIKPSVALKGQISVDRQRLLQGDPVAITYSVTNIGNIDLSSVDLDIITVNVADTAIYDTLADQASLVMGASYGNTRTLDTQKYTAKDYLVILRANIAGAEETLSGTYFRVEGAPSSPSLYLPMDASDTDTLTPMLGINNASDPNDDKLTYQFELYSDRGLSSLVASGDAVPEGANITSWQVPVTLQENVTYYWRARAYDGELYGDWMTPASFRVNVENDPPTAPTLSAPADNGTVDTLTPLLAVNNAYDPDSANLTYNFQVSSDIDFTTIIASKTGVFEGPATTLWQVTTPLQENTGYYWRAQADDWLVEGPWMTPARFFVNTANDAPTAPAIISPADGAEIATQDTDIVITNSTDPDSTTLSYLFEVDTLETFDSPNLIRSAEVPQGQGTTLFPAANLMDNTLYCARAKANDGLADSPWSDISCFFVNTVNDPPTAPTLSNPSDGSGVKELNPTLSVHNSTDFDRDVLTYEFELYGDASMTNLLASGTSVAEIPEITSWTVPVNLVENDIYYWRARAYDGQAYSGWMNLASFMVNTANDAPNAPTLNAPAEGSSIATVTPVLSVNNATDPENDSLTYDFEVYSGGALIRTVPGIPEDVSGITSITLNPALSDNTVFNWRARAYDGDRYGAWMEMATFSTHLPSTSITSTIDFDPNTLNQKSNGTWVTVYIELPSGYDVTNIDVSSIRLEGSIPAETWPYSIGDYDHDGIKDLMVKFRRSDVINILPNGDSVRVHVTGKAGTTTFEGVDTIRVIK